MKCTNSHDVADGSKFCGQCGDKVEQEAQTTMAKCVACAGDQPANNKFCGGCGEAMPTSETELEQMMADLAAPIGGQMAKSTTGDAGDAAAETAGDDLLNETGDDVAAAAAASDAPDLTMAKALVDRLNLVGRQNREILRRSNAGDAAVRDRMGLMSKAFAALIGRVRGIAAAPAVEQPKGARSVLAGGRQVKVLAKNTAASEAAAQQENVVRGQGLMAKAMAAKGAGKAISTDDIARLNFFTNRNASLDDIAQVDEGLAERVAVAIAA